MSAKRPAKDKVFDKFSGGRYLDAIAYIRVSDPCRQLTTSEGAVLRAIASRMNAANILGSSWNLSHDDIAASALVTPRTSMRAVKALAAFGLIAVEERYVGGHQAKNKYRLTSKVFEAYAKAHQSDTVSPMTDQSDTVSPMNVSMSDTVSPMNESMGDITASMGDICVVHERQGVTRNHIDPTQYPNIYTGPPLPSPAPTKPKANLRAVLTDVTKAADEVMRVFRPRGREFFPAREWEAETRRLCALYSLEEFRAMASYLVREGKNNQPGAVAADLETYIKASKGEADLPHAKGKNEVQHVSPKAPPNRTLPKSDCGVDWIAAMTDLDEVDNWLERLKAGALTQSPATLQALRIRYRELAGREYA